MGSSGRKFRSRSTTASLWSRRDRLRPSPARGGRPPLLLWRHRNRQSQRLRLVRPRRQAREMRPRRGVRLRTRPALRCYGDTFYGTIARARLGEVKMTQSTAVSPSLAPAQTKPTGNTVRPSRPRSGGRPPNPVPHLDELPFLDHHVRYIRPRCMVCLTWLDSLIVVKCSPPRAFPDLCSIE